MSDQAGEPGKQGECQYGVPDSAQLRDSVDRILLDWARERPDLDFTPVGIVTRLARVRAHLDAGLQEVFRRYGLTPPDFRVIIALRRAGAPYELPQARLMTQLALTSGTVSVRVDRLASHGVVQRVTHPTDRRGQLVKLTAEGLRLFDKVAPVHLANEDRLLSALTDDERETLADLLRKLLVSFESGVVEVGLPLGLRLEPSHLARARRATVGLSDRPGLLVTETVAGTAAADAGLARGDLIVEANGQQVRSDAALAAAINETRPGDELRLSVLHGDEQKQVRLRLPPL